MSWLTDALFGRKEDREEDAIVQMFKPLYDHDPRHADDYYCGVCGFVPISSPCEHLTGNPMYIRRARK